jgi:hypothetical protein
MSLSRDVIVGCGVICCVKHLPQFLFFASFCLLLSGTVKAIMLTEKRWYASDVVVRLDGV